MLKFKKQKGVSLFIVVAITSLVISIAFGLSAALISRIRVVFDVQKSISAFFAADSGTEEALYHLFKDSSPGPNYQNNKGRFSYKTVISCGKNFSGCPEGRGFGRDDGKLCPSKANYCLKSIGSYSGTSRAIASWY